MLVLLTVRQAHCQERGTGTGNGDGPGNGRGRSEEPAPIEPRAIAAWDHFEVSMGFLAGQRRYHSTPFAYKSGDAASMPGATSLVEPFQRAPYDNVNQYGLRYEARLVVSYVRMMMGVDIPFSSFNVGNASGNYLIGGTPREVSVRGLTTRDLRFGIGVEYPFGPLAPYVDVVGAVHWVSTDLNIDGSKLEYGATTFALSARGGIRLHLRKWFYATAAGEVGLAGDVRWGSELSVGFAFM
jgi:hypothetical protein